MSKKNSKVVRMLERAMAVRFGRGAFGGRSGPEPDRSAQKAHKLFQKVKAHADKDPNNKFGTYLARLFLQILKDIVKKQ